MGIDPEDIDEDDMEKLATIIKVYEIEYLDGTKESTTYVRPVTLRKIDIINESGKTI